MLQNVSTTKLSVLVVQREGASEVIVVFRSGSLQGGDMFMFNSINLVFTKTIKYHVQVEVIFEGLQISHIKKHTRWQVYTMLLKSTKWINALSNIDPSSGYACYVQTWYWCCCFIGGSWLFPSLCSIWMSRVLNLDEGCHHFFFVINRGCPSLVCRLSNSCLAWSKERLDYIETFVMLKSIKNQAIQYGAKVPGIILWIMPTVVYANSSFSISPYKIFMMSMMSFVCPRMRWRERKLI